MKLKQRLPRSSRGECGFAFFNCRLPVSWAIGRHFILASACGVVLASACAQETTGLLAPATLQPADGTTADVILQSGHSGRITALVFNRNGDVLASASEDRTILLWSAAQGRQMFWLRGHTGTVRALAFSRDGALLASGSDDHTIRVWEIKTGRIMATWQTPDESTFHLAFSRDGSRLLAAGGGPYEGGTAPVSLWDVPTGRKLRTLEAMATGVTNVFFSSDGSRVVVASETGDIDIRGTIKTFDSGTGNLLETRTALVQAASEDGAWMAIQQGVGKQLATRIFESPGERQVTTLEGQIGPLVFAPSGDWLAYSRVPYDTVTVQRSRGGETRSLHYGTAAAFSKFAVSPDGRWLASAGNGPGIQVWDVQTGRVAQTISGQFGAYALAFASDGKRLAIGAGGDGSSSTLQIWDVRRQTELPSPRVAHAMLGLAFSPDGRDVAVSTRSLEILDVGSGSPIRQFGCAPDVVFSPVFSTDGKLIAGNCRGVITIWSVETGSEVLHVGERNILNGSPVALSPNGRLLAAGGTQDLRIYDVVDRRVVATWPTTAPVSTIAFSRDGRRISAGTHVQLRTRQGQGLPVLDAVAGQNASVSVWDIDKGQLLWSAPAGQWVSALAFSADGKFTLVSSEENWQGTGSIRQFDADSGQMLRVLIPKVDSHSAAAFAPDGDWFAAGPRAPGSGVKLWRLR